MDHPRSVTALFQRLLGFFCAVAVVAVVESAATKATKAATTWMPAEVVAAVVSILLFLI